MFDRHSKAVVKGGGRDGDVVTVELRMSRLEDLSYPIAPALLRTWWRRKPLLTLHQLVARDGLTLTFESYDSDEDLPRVGTRCELVQLWWGDAMDAVRDQSVTWVRRAYPDNGDHGHCLISWDAISSYADPREGYESEFGWLTVDAYREAIEQDRYRIRRAWRSVEEDPDSSS